MKHRRVLVLALLAATGCKHLDSPRREFNLPPAAMMQHPGPGVTGPGPGVLDVGPVAPAACAAFGATSQLGFIGPEGMKVQWDMTGAGQFDSEPLIAPARFNFGQGAIYRLKISNIEGRPGLELYPTIEVAPAMPRTSAYIAHNAVPVQFTEEDLDQVQAGNFVTKVLYLPDPEFQELAVAGVETLVSTRLDPGVDPVVEADKRGSILAIIRIGNKDFQVPMGNGNGEEINPASYNAVMGARNGGPVPMAMGGAPMGMGGVPMGGPPMGMGGPISGAPVPIGPGMGVPGGPQMIAGVTTTPYGMPITGTPIGIAGPPHIPLGGPAGLRRHEMKNHTRVAMPEPTGSMKMHVKQEPGFSYPVPPNTVHIRETYIPPSRRDSRDQDCD